MLGGNAFGTAYFGQAFAGAAAVATVASFPFRPLPLVRP